MEKGPLSVSSTPTLNSDELEDDQEEEDEDEDEDDDGEQVTRTINNHYIDSAPANYHHHHRLITNGSPASGSGSGSGFRFRIPSGSRQVPSPLGVTGTAKPKNYPNYSNYARFDGNPNYTPTHTHTHNSNPRFVNTSSLPKPASYVRSDGGGSGVKRETDPVGEMVTSIRMLGEGFVKMEKMKIEMAKETERMRMEMEIKRTEMILESQQKIVEAFAKGISANKKVKRMTSLES